jgi:hypothetical protein
MRCAITSGCTQRETLCLHSTLAFLSAQAKLCLIVGTTAEAMGTLRSSLGTQNNSELIRN